MKKYLRKLPGWKLLWRLKKWILGNQYFRQYGKWARAYQQQAGLNPASFSAIEIETINRCNSMCEFCPVNKRDDTREFKLMDEALFAKIINELQALNYNGEVALYSNNEPFMDDRLEQFARIARDALPNAYIHITTNSTLLTLERFKEIIPCLDAMHINRYEDGINLHKRAQALHDYCEKDPQLQEKVLFYRTNIRAVRTSRGGQAPNRNRRVKVPKTCHLPWVQLVIRSSGYASLCCNDGLGKFTLGDANTQSLTEIWHGKAYQDVRKKLMKGRYAIPLCKNCDSVHKTSGTRKRTAYDTV